MLFLLLSWTWLTSDPFWGHTDHYRIGIKTEDICHFPLKQNSLFTGWLFCLHCLSAGKCASGSFLRVTGKLNIFRMLPYFMPTFFCAGKVMKLSPKAEEVATFFAKMLDHEYTTKDIFRKNFFKDWRKVWTAFYGKIVCGGLVRPFKNMNIYRCLLLGRSKILSNAGVPNPRAMAR